eukprot:159066-Pyramimonas_sp.AAC.1
MGSICVRIEGCGGEITAAGSDQGAAAGVGAVRPVGGGVHPNGPRQPGQQGHNHRHSHCLRGA